jgi:hypothetical protein
MRQAQKKKNLVVDLHDVMLEVGFHGPNLVENKKIAL